MISHQCTINYDHMIFGCKVMAWTDILFWSNFCPFISLGDLKTKIVKNEKNA